MLCEISNKEIDSRQTIKHDGIYLSWDIYKMACFELRKSSPTSQEIKEVWKDIMNYNEICFKATHFIRRLCKHKMLLKYNELNQDRYGEYIDLVHTKVEQIRFALKQWALRKYKKEITSVTREEFTEFLLLLLDSELVEKTRDHKIMEGHLHQGRIVDDLCKDVYGVQNLLTKRLIYEVSL